MSRADRRAPPATSLVGGEGTPAPVPIRWPQLARAAELGGGEPAGGAAALLSAAAAELERARQEGRAEGLAETARLRQQLAALLGNLAERRVARDRELGYAVVEGALAVIETWLEGSELDRRARFAPIVLRWAREVGAEAPTVAQVAPGDVAALREAIGELPIEVRADPGLLPGDVQLRSERALVELLWRERLGELREELMQMFREQAAGQPARVVVGAAEPP